MSAKVKTILKCRKSPGSCGKCNQVIPKGAPYRLWAFRYGGKRIRCMADACSPKPSELINSPFLSGIQAAVEARDQAVTDKDPDALRSVAEDVRSLGEEAQSSFDNMPDGLQQGDTGQLLEARAQKCEEIASALEEAADNLENALTEAEEVDMDVE